MSTPAPVLGPETPVVLIVFNRAAITRQTIRAIGRVAPPVLYVVADGPRPDRPEDVEKCAATRAAIDEVDWPCDVRRLFRRDNLGCEASIELGLDSVFAEVDRAIIVEDDCVPDPTFFAFCAELLDRHADDEQIMMVAGNSLEVPPKLFDGDSYAFTCFASVWGWATWARAWQRHRAVFPRSHEGTANVHGTQPPVRLGPTRLPRGGLETEAGRRYFGEVVATDDGNAFSWDSHWWVSLLLLEARAVTPAVNLVQNVGFGEDATYTRSGKIGPPSQSMTFPLRHPRDTARHVPVQRELELTLARANGRLARRARALLGQGRTWAVARRVAKHPVTTSTVRAVSRVRAARQRLR